jgi:hypothetical protein
MEAEALFGTGEDRTNFQELATELAPAEDVTDDNMPPLVIASIMYCPAIAAATYGFGC